MVSLKDSIHNKILPNSRSKANSPQDKTDELKRNKEEDEREELEQQRLLEEQDRISGLKLKDYIIHHNFEGMMEFLE